MKNLDAAVREIVGTADLLERSLKLAGLVTRLFLEAGCELVVVGGSAVEFYTEGAYMSGDIDMCRRSLAPVPLRTAQDLMGRLQASGGPRSWKVAGLFMDLLGLVENEARTPYRTLATPYGPIAILPVELTLVERVLPAVYPQPDVQARGVAKKLMAACVTGVTPADWNEVERLARLPSFNVANELAALRKEVERETEARL